MPFKSQAQRRLFYAKAKTGEIPMETVKQWEEETPRKKSLPERIEKKGFICNFEDQAWQTKN